MRYEIEFRPHTEKPAFPLGSPERYRAALILNKCDGYHHVFARWDEDEWFLGFTEWVDWTPFTAGTDFIAWALLPDEVTLVEDFEALAKIQQE